MLGGGNLMNKFSKDNGQKKIQSFVEEFISQNMKINQKLLQSFNQVSNQMSQKQDQIMSKKGQILSFIGQFKKMQEQFRYECKVQWSSIFKEILSIFSSIIQAYQNKLQNAHAELQSKNSQIDYLMKNQRDTFASKDSMCSKTSMAGDGEEHLRSLKCSSGESILLSHQEDFPGQEYLSNSLSRTINIALQKPNAKQNVYKGDYMKSHQFSLQMKKERPNNKIKQEELSQNFSFYKYEQFNASQQLKTLSNGLKNNTSNNSKKHQGLVNTPKQLFAHNIQSQRANKRIHSEYQSKKKRISNCENQEFYSNHNSKLQNLRKSILGRRKVEHTFDKIF